MLLHKEILLTYGFLKQWTEDKFNPKAEVGWRNLLVKSLIIYTGCFRRNSNYFRRWQYGLLRVNMFVYPWV